MRAREALPNNEMKQTRSTVAEMARPSQLISVFGGPTIVTRREGNHAQ